jgi:CMP-N-acetylneuraminic acid synthetase
MDKIYPFIMGKKYSIDINTKLDFEIAECLMKKEMNSNE